MENPVRLRFFAIDLSTTVLEIIYIATKAEFPEIHTQGIVV